MDALPSPSLTPSPTPPGLRRVALAGFITIALFFGGLGTWVATAQLQGAIIARGEVIVENYRKQVQHLTGGIVEDILVREGDWVERDQVLIRLNGETVAATRALYRARMNSLQAKRARLEAALADRTTIDWPQALQTRAAEDAELAQILASEDQIFAANRAARDSQEALYRAQIDQAESLEAGLARQEASIQAIIASMEDEIQAKAKLLDEGHIQRLHILELERNQNNNQARLEDVRTDRAQAEKRVQALELQISDLHQRYLQQAATQLGEVRDQIAALHEQLRPAEDAYRRLEIRAPVAGVVVNLNVRTEGGVIGGGQPLMEIVPRDSSLIVSTQVPTSKIDEVRRGQKAKVSLSAFSTRTTPKVDGAVSYVSADRMSTPQSSGERATQPYYLVYVTLDEDSLKAAIGDPSRLAPGMPAEVYIQTDASTMLSYILSPITGSLDRSFRE